MKNLRLVILILVLILIGGTIWILQQPDRIQLQTGEMMTLGPVSKESLPIEVGKEAPDFVLMDYDNVPHHLSDYRGNYVMLNFWAKWCPFCIEEMPDFQTVYDEYNNQGLEIVAVNRQETKEVAKGFSDSLNLNYILLLNRADDVARAYKLTAMPSTYFIDKDGILVDIKFGPMSVDEMKEKLKENFGIGASSMVKEETMRDMGNEIEYTGVNPEISSPITSYDTIMETDGVKHIIPLDEIFGGGPPKDGIPSIDNPKFDTVEEADKYLNDDGLGISVSFGGVDRFYAFQILNWHEIVNDTIGGQPALVTYCPLCGTGIVFDPIVKGKQTEFGTSGKLWNSNLVMYDRQTDSYWSQVLGRAIVGDLAGQKLTILPHDNVRWGDWKKLHPEGEVLNRDTGRIRDYSRSPYGDYDTNRSVFFPVNFQDDSFHPKTITYGIDVNGVVKVYPLEEVQKMESPFIDTVGHVDIEVTLDKETDAVRFKRLDTGEDVESVFGFWFSWISVYPDSEVFRAE